MANITMDMDWGARGAQLSGAEVQAFIKSQLRTLQSQVASLTTTTTGLREQLAQMEKTLKSATEGCLVAYHRQSDNSAAAVPYWEWSALEARGEKADGVLVMIDGMAPIVVAPNESNLKWSKPATFNSVDVNHTYSEAVADYSGRNNTTAIMSNAPELFGSTRAEQVQYAAGYCSYYSRTYISDSESSPTEIGKGEGEWWLPSIGELTAIWKRKNAINLCLAAIHGATQLKNSYYWSSTEGEDDKAWCMSFDTGAISNQKQKTTAMNSVRAVSSFY